MSRGARFVQLVVGMVMIIDCIEVYEARVRQNVDSLRSGTKAKTGPMPVKTLTYAANIGI